MHTCLQLIILQAIFVRSTQATCPFPSSKDDICTSIKEFLNSLISLKAAIQENFGIIEKTKDQSSIKIQQGFGYKAKKYCSDIINELKQLYNLSSPNFYEETSLAMEFSHMAALGFEVGDKIVWGCGGSLISDKFVLTAAHCIVDKNLGQVNYVRLGVNRKIEDVENFQVVNVYGHPDYRPPLRYNDIALIELHDSVLSSTYPNVACLNIDRNVNGYDKFNVTGWGLLQNFGESADQVQKVEVDLLSWMECKQHYPADGELKSGIVDDLQICAGYPRRDTCQGDSGEPLQKSILFSPLPRLNTIFGVSSFGKGCGLSSSPGVYTRVSNYIDWIESIVWPN